MWSNVTPTLLGVPVPRTPEADGDPRRVKFDMRVPLVWTVVQVLDRVLIWGGMEVEKLDRPEQARIVVRYQSCHILVFLLIS